MADDQNTEGMIERLRNSPRTVSTIIVILIIAGAIFAFSDRGTKPSPSPEGTANTVGESPTPATSATPGDENTSVSAESPTPSTTTPKPLPEASETDDAYVEVAAAGQGTTHLARQATRRYLDAQKPDFDVTNEHRIYIEDYIKDHLERVPLHVGGTRTISKDLIREAVNASKELTDAQLKNLERYSRVVRW